MPIYEYRCHECGTQFSLLRRVQETDEPTSCPQCLVPGVQRSTFHSTEQGWRAAHEQGTYANGHASRSLHQPAREVADVEQAAQPEQRALSEHGQSPPPRFSDEVAGPAGSRSGGSDAEQHVETLVSAVKELQADRERLVEDVARLTAARSAAEREAQEQDERRDSARKMVEGFEERVKELQRAIEGLRSQDDVVREEQRSLHASVAGARGELQELEQRVQAYRDEVQRLSDLCVETEMTLRLTDGSLALRRQELTRVDEALAARRSEYERLQTAIGEASHGDEVSRARRLLAAALDLLDREGTGALPEAEQRPEASERTIATQPAADEREDQLPLHIAAASELARMEKEEDEAEDEAARTPAPAEGGPRIDPLESIQWVPSPAAGVGTGLVGLVVVLAALAGSVLLAGQLAGNLDGRISSTEAWTLGVGSAGLAMLKVGIAMLLVSVIGSFRIRLQRAKEALHVLVPKPAIEQEGRADAAYWVDTPFGAATVTREAPEEPRLQRLESRLWLPTLLMGAVIAAIGLVLALAEASTTAIPAVSLEALTQSTQFLGGTLLLLGIAFLLDGLLSSLRQDGAEAQESLRVAVYTPDVSRMSKLFVVLLAVGLLLSLLQFGFSAWVTASGEGALTSGVAWLRSLGEAGLGIVLAGIAVSLAMVARTVAFEFWRFRHLMATGTERAA